MYSGTGRDSDILSEEKEDEKSDMPKHVAIGGTTQI